MLEYLNAKIEYGTRVTPEVADIIASAMGAENGEAIRVRWHRDDDNAKGDGLVSISHEAPVLTTDLIKLGNAHGIKFVINPGNATPEAFKAIGDAIKSMAARLSVIEHKISDEGEGSGQTYNNKVSVHVPGNALLDIQTVWVFTDACSDQLRSYLEDGWRIVAVCPQPDQRRPDYVLGHTDPKAYRNV